MAVSIRPRREGETPPWEKNQSQETRTAAERPQNNTGRTLRNIRITQRQDVAEREKAYDDYKIASVKPEAKLPTVDARRPFAMANLASEFRKDAAKTVLGDDYDDKLSGLAWEMALEKTGPERISQLDQKMADAEKAGKQAGDMLYAGGRELPQSHLDKYGGQVREQNETYARLAEEKRKAQDDYYGAIAALSDQPQYRHYQELGAKLDSEARESRNKEPIGAERHPMDQNLPDIAPYNFMNETERGVYQYLLGKGDKAGAQEFLGGYMAETLNARAGQKIASGFEDIENPVERTAAKYVYGLEAGLDQAGSGAKQLFSKDRLTTSATQFASAGVRDSLKDTGPQFLGSSLGQAGYDLITTTANMAPSILLSSLTAGAGLAAAAPVVGSAAMGLTASGNAYNQALGEGYLPSQARNYAALVGASEAGLQYLLGGISSLGGTITGKTAQATIRNIDNALLRIAASAGVNMFGEGAEEYLQDILEPAFRNLCFGENNQIKLVSEEAAYSFLLGALSAGLMEGGHITGNELNLDRVGDAVRKGGKLETLLDRAVELGAGTESGKLAGQLRDGTLRTNNGNVGQLLEAFVRDGGDVRFMSEAGTTPQSATPTAPLAQGGRGSNPEGGQETAGMPQVLQDMAREMAEEETTSPVLRDIREKLARGETVSSRDTERVLGDPTALEALGVDISGLTKSQQRAEVRKALAEDWAGREAGATTLNDGQDNPPVGQRPTAPLTQGGLETEAGREAGRGVQEAAPYNGETEANREAAPSSAPRPDEGIGPYTVPSHEGEGQDAVTLRDGADIAGDMRRVQSAATSLGLNGSKALSSAYDETMARMVDPEQAFTVFTQTYNRALNGETGSVIGPSGKAFDALRLAAESSAKLDAQQAAQARYFGKNAGLVRDENWKKARLSSKDSRRLDAMGKVTGTQIRFTDRIVTEDGKEANARYKNGVLELSLNAEDPFMVSVIHEAVHRLRETAPEVYQSLSDFVLRTMSEEGLEFNRYIRGVGYGTTDVDLLTEETVADAFGRMLRDGTALDKFVQDDRTVGQKILDFFKDLLNSVRRVLEHKNLQLSKEQIAAFRDLEDSVAGMKRLLEGALEQTEKSANQVVHSEEYDGTISEPKYSKKEGAYDTEGSRETREAFIERNGRRGWKTRNYETAEIAYLPVGRGDTSFTAERVRAELNGLGIESFYHGGLEANENGVTYTAGQIAAAVGNNTVAINAKAYGNAKEIAGHEAYHIWGNTNECVRFNEILNSNVIRESDECADFMTEIIMEYAFAGPTSNETIKEEFRARIAGLLHAEKDTARIRRILRDYDAVKAAWNKLVEQNSAKPRYSIKEYTDAEKNQHVKDAVSYFGRTYKWAETGYITTDGKRLDFSGKHEGGPGGYRTVDHRDIRDALGDDYGGDDYSGSMVQFMSEGNIRISPESGGINLSVMPTKAQLDVLSDFISKYRGEVILDLDTLDGNTVSSTEYPRGTHANKVLSDIKAYFDDGTQPHVSEVSRFRYSIKMDNKGRTLTDQQMEYFKDSKAVDGDGKLLTLYHGTRKGGFTTFRDWAYLTATESYAKRYADHNTGETVYEVYANVTKPFDTRLKECRDLWRSQFFGEYSRTELQETGLPDWTDGYDLAEWIEENDLDYDCILLDEGADYDRNGNVKERGISYVVRSSEQIKNVDNKNPTSDPDIRYSRSDKELLAEYVKKYGEIPKGEKPSREIVMPRKTGDGKNLSQTVRTVMEAKATPEEMIPSIEALAANGDYSYEAYSDKQAIADASAKIERVGFAQSVSDWAAGMKKGEVSKQNTAMGWALYNSAANSGDTKTALMVLDHMVRHQRSAAQALQATRILKKLSPETQLYQAVKSVDAMQEEVNQRFGDGKGPTIRIDRELAAQFLAARDQETRDEILKDIYRDIGRQLPSRFVDKWNAWRYLAMLGNPRTHVRNILGNAGFTPLVAAKNLTATAIESAVYRASGGKLARTKGTIGFGQRDRALLAAGWSDYDKVQETAMSGGKYDDAINVNKYVDEGRRIFKNPVLETARKANSAALDKEDVWFSRPHYAYAMAQYCKANGIGPEQVSNGNGLEKARAYAILEAQKATYRDTNAFSQAVSDLGRTNRNVKNPAKKLIGVAMEGILPFRKTPANILARGVEYSPAGLLKSLTYDLAKVRTGERSGAEVIDSMSAGLTGTGLLALGVFLAAQGLVRGHGEDDEKEKKFQEMMGRQAYSLEAFGQSVTLDWLAPECLPFFIGVNLWEITAEEDEAPTMSKLLSAVTTVTEPLLEMSCLQSLNAVFETVGYASSNDLGALPAALASAATSYLTQAIPTVLGQLERTAEDRRYTTYTEKNAFLTEDMQYTLGRASARVPGVDYGQIPYIDAWGRMENTGQFGERAFNNFLNPAYTSRIDTSKMESELLRLYQATGSTGVLPSRAARSVSVDGGSRDLTGQEYVAYATARGQTAYKVLSALVESPGWQSMADEDKVSTVSMCYQYADGVAKARVVSDYTPDGWVGRAIAAAESSGVAPEQYIPLYLAQKEIVSLKDKSGKTIPNSESLLKMELIYAVNGLSDKQRQALFEAFGVGKSVQHYNKALVSEQLGKMRKMER